MYAVNDRNFYCIAGTQSKSIYEDPVEVFVINIQENSDIVKR